MSRVHENELGLALWIFHDGTASLNLAGPFGAAFVNDSSDFAFVFQPSRMASGGRTGSV